jgi:hypothetical protein
MRVPYFFFLSLFINRKLYGIVLNPPLSRKINAPRIFYYLSKGLFFAVFLTIIAKNDYLGNKQQLNLS